jgi:galactose mutarotase-like enzyme
MAGSKTERDVFGTLPDGRKVDRIVLRGEGGFEARIITHGAVLQALIAPDAPVRIENESAAVNTSSTQIQNSDLRS